MSLGTQRTAVSNADLSLERQHANSPKLSPLKEAEALSLFIGVPSGTGDDVETGYVAPFDTDAP